MTNQTDPKLTPQEFAQKIKAKHPQYKDVDDLELTKKMIEKYPQYKDKVNLSTPTPPTEKKKPVQKSGASAGANTDPYGTA